MRLLSYLAVVAVVGGLGLVGCGPVEDGTRSGKLLTMAAQEAGLISSLSQRLTRQLNIADMQISAGQNSEAIKTLALAAATLKVEEADKKTIDDFGRIAGWTSVAELSHSAKNDTAALDAYLNAVEALHSVTPEATRAQYVLSLSQVAFELKGKEEAGRLLVSGGEWASKIPVVGTRRFALTSFSSALVEYDNLEDARAVLRQEADPAWRADTLAALAQADTNRHGGRGDRAGLNAFVSSPALGAKSGAFNKDVRYKSNFQQQQLQQGVAPNGEEGSH